MEGFKEIELVGQLVEWVRDQTRSRWWALAPMREIDGAIRGLFTQRPELMDAKSSAVFSKNPDALILVFNEHDADQQFQVTLTWDAPIGRLNIRTNLDPAASGVHEVCAAVAARRSNNEPRIDFIRLAPDQYKVYPLPNTCILVGKTKHTNTHSVVIRAANKDEFLACLNGLFKYNESLSNLADSLRVKRVWSDYEDGTEYWFVDCRLLQDDADVVNRLLRSYMHWIPGYKE